MAFHSKRGLFLAYLLLHLLLLSTTTQAQVRGEHPLDPLTKKEIERTLEILRVSGVLDNHSMIPTLTLKEPPKREVLASKPGELFRREAWALIYQRTQRKLLEVTVDLRKGSLGESKERVGTQPPVMLSEFNDAPPIVKADPRFKEAMKRRGIERLDEVAVDIWAYGTPDTKLSQRNRLLRAVAYHRGNGKNFYAKPIEGFTAIVNMDDKKVEKILDSEVLPIPPYSFELDPQGIGKPRDPVLPLVLTQPSGPSFEVLGNEVRWQNWNFRFSMHPREGLVLHLVRYDDRGRMRPVLYRASLSEMMVPYGHPDPHWTYRAAFDEGEYGIGRYSGPLEVGTDVPENARLFDALFVDDFGKPYVVKDAIALYEKDGGLLWKHLDMYSGGNFSRRSRELVIGFVTTISNYDYGFNWVFRQDGSLELEAQLSGILLAKGSALKSMNEDKCGCHPDMKFAHLVAPHVTAPHHQHFFNFRLDLDIDGATENRLVELNAEALPEGKKNPALNAFGMHSTLLKTELQAIRDLNFGSSRKWKVTHTNLTTSLGYEPGYLLLPGENTVPFLHKKSALRTRGGFINHPVWATQFRDDEMYAAGPYPSQRKASDGLPLWARKNRSLDSQDIVLWYTFGVTHAPRPEDWPVMPVHKAGFKLIPSGFFDRNPAMDVPQ